MIRAADIWLPAYVAQSLKPASRASKGGGTLLLSVCDHFEPFVGKVDVKTALERVAFWEKRLPEFADRARDSFGAPYRHNFFYPLDEYHPEVLDRVAAMCEKGLGRVEVHLHHQGESSSELAEKLESMTGLLHSRHGLLEKDPAHGRIRYGFIHGNWALDNSRPDGKWCGVNDELTVLKNTGCYADFTLPSAPDRTQTRMINSIYYATDDPVRPKSHDRGRPARVGMPPGGDLLMVQGVLALNWKSRKWGLLPRLENSDLSGSLPPDAARAPMWLKYAPRVLGAPGFRFLKLHCHGAPEWNREAVLGKKALELYRYLAELSRRDPQIRFRFVTCREMVQTIHALEMGGDPWAAMNLFQGGDTSS